MWRQSTARFTSFTNIATEDLRVSQISIRGEFVRMKRVNCGKLYSRERDIAKEKKLGKIEHMTQYITVKLSSLSKTAKD